HLQLQVAEAVERLRAAAGRDPDAVLATRRHVLDVPELAVGGGDGRDGAGAMRGDDDDESRAQRGGSDAKRSGHSGGWYTRNSRAITRRIPGDHQVSSR